MKKYGIWKVVLVTADGEIVRVEITGTSGKNAKARVEARYKGCEVLKMTRFEWLTGFEYSTMSKAIREAYPNYVNEIMDVLVDCGFFETTPGGVEDD